MKTKKILALVLAFAMMISAFAACDNKKPAEGGDTSTANTSTADTNEPDDTATGMYPGTPDADMITVNIGTEPPKLNTTISTDTISFAIFRNTLENLTRIDRENNILPAAAESWDVSEDKMTYTFHLRDGMTWENGDPVTAADFEFAWKELLNPENAAEYGYFIYFIEGAQAYNEGTGSRDDVKATAIDEKTLEVVLTQPTEYFLFCTTFGSLAPVNQKFYEEVGAEAYGTEADKLLSNGPYKFESWTHEADLTIVKNDTYWNAEAIKLPKIKYVMISDSNAALNAFKAGEVDLVTLTGDHAAQMTAEGYPVQHYDDGASFYLEMNLENEILENKNIRAAITYAIDREAYVATIQKNDSKPATSLVPPALKGKNGPFSDEVDSPIPTAGDVDKAKEYLEAGLAEINMTAEEVGAKLTMITDDGDLAMRIGAFVKEQLNSKLGIDIVVESMPFKSRLERMTNKDFSLVFAGWGPDYDDPNTFLDLFVTGGGNNHTGYANPEYDKLIADAAVETDPDARMDKFFEVEKIILEDMMIAPVYWRVRDFITSEKLEGVMRTAFQDMTFIEAYIK
jgi:ABC-type oligopeptide transport system, periplasmic component